MPKGSLELTNARKEEIISACAKLYETMHFKDITIKEIGNVDPQALADLVDHAELHRVIGTIDDISNGGLGHAALYIKLILRHIPLAQELLQSGTDRLV